MAVSQKRAAGLSNLIGAGRSDTDDKIEKTVKVETPNGIAEGLLLSPVKQEAVEWFKENPENVVFENLKTDSYWTNLKRDILEAGAILNPLITLSDGTLVEGHSRIKVIRELKQEGLWDQSVPYRKILSDITPEEIKKRVYLGNLSRFEINEDTRLALYTAIWPQFFTQSGGVGGRIALSKDRTLQADHGDTVKIDAKEANTKTQEADHGDTLTAADIAKELDKSIPQAKRDRKLTILATEIAKKKGREMPLPEDIAEARKEINVLRREKKNIEIQAEKEVVQKIAGTLKRKISKASEDYALAVEETLTLLSSNNLIAEPIFNALVEMLNNGKKAEVK